MWLLNVEKYTLEEFPSPSELPQYVILSHTWGDEGDEVLFRHPRDGNLITSGTVPVKLRGCCSLAKDHGYKYVWIDTCCINRSNSPELQEAITSMFRWYENAEECFVYLSDIPKHDGCSKGDHKICSSRWFTRGWTLQELLAPPVVEFYDSGWNLLGTKEMMYEEVEEATGIPWVVLTQGVKLEDVCIAQKMSWVAKRETKRDEDIAYCLQGIFGVSIPLNYGEGTESAFRRLQVEIMYETTDDSILAWEFRLETTTSDGDQPNELPEDLHNLATDVAYVPGGVLASSPSAFANCGAIGWSDNLERSITSPPDELGGVLQLCLKIIDDPSGSMLGVLQCHLEDDEEQSIAIPLLQSIDGPRDRLFRPEGYKAVVVPTPPPDEPRTCFFISRTAKPSQVGLRPIQPAFRYRIQGAEIMELEIDEVDPPCCWNQRAGLLTAYKNVDAGGRVSSRTMVRLVNTNNKASEFILILDLNVPRRLDQNQGNQLGAASRSPAPLQVSRASGKYSPVGYLLASSKHESLAEIADSIQCEAFQQLGSSATDGILCIELAIGTLKNRTFTVSLTAVQSDICPVDVSIELERIRLSRRVAGAYEEHGELCKQAEEAGISTRAKRVMLDQSKAEVDRLDEQIQKLKVEREIALAEYTEKQTEVNDLGENEQTLQSLRDTKRQHLSDRLQEITNLSFGLDDTYPEEHRMQRTLSLLLCQNLWPAVHAILNEFNFKVDFVFDVDDGSYSPLTYAASRGKDAVVERLLQVPADRDMQDGDSYTPLGRANGLKQSTLEALGAPKLDYEEALGAKKKKKKKGIVFDTSPPELKDEEDLDEFWGVKKKKKRIAPMLED